MRIDGVIVDLVKEIIEVVADMIKLKKGGKGEGWVEGSGTVLTHDRVLL